MVVRSLIFPSAHDPCIIFLLASMVEVLARWLLHKTRRNWPCMALHVTYNGLHLLLRHPVSHEHRGRVLPWREGTRLLYGYPRHDAKPPFKETDRRFQVTNS
ncbi:CPBP family glutamic-type intramembrane protease [Ottowia thiooxydans]|uniref:CPBP family glutamic-type intramembrane protease n=1 Tax=Ottowia thiooxydans TaxID=219182 RepID=UPI000A026978